MKAHPVHIRVKTLSGIAICGVCGTWTSFERPCDERDLAQVRCTGCRAPHPELWQGTFWATIEITPAPKEGT